MMLGLEILKNLGRLAPLPALEGISTEANEWILQRLT
jgi:hypothetical protein